MEIVKNTCPRCGTVFVSDGKAINGFCNICRRTRPKVKK